MLQLQLATHSGARGTAIRTAPQWHDPLDAIDAAAPVIPATELGPACSTVMLNSFQHPIQRRCPLHRDGPWRGGCFAPSRLRV